jgi:hypothetical protein
MPNSIVDLIKDELEWFQCVGAQYSFLFPPAEKVPVLYPLPFFGDIRSADVITVALNPSWDEFIPARKWLPNLDENALSTRALHYFDLPEPSPHKWFSKLERACLPIGRSYRRGLAHIDLLSCPTLRPREMSDHQRRQFGQLVNETASRAQRFLDLCCMAKVIFYLDHTVGDGNGGHWDMWSKAIEHVSHFQKRATTNGYELPILRVNGPNGLPSLVADRRDEIREYLMQGPRLCHAIYA